jgi:hypothetical protein
VKASRPLRQQLLDVLGEHVDLEVDEVPGRELAQGRLGECAG